MTETQVFSLVNQAAGSSGIFHWNWTGRANNSNVPAKTVLDITTLTFNYFPPSGAANVARAVVDAFSATGPKGTKVWEVDVYVEKEKTLHLPFPIALRIEAGGYVEVTPGSAVGVAVNANGRLVDV
jgi:hypothetical protein